ncbi:MAG: DNA alkylation repair protein [Prolixibacteraceae bacterium]|jgi:3-methyladenine DNA glycosylase AlkD|nr:DNA alkylation repair protein [Prolixibacteraceae bacterium]
MQLYSTLQDIRQLLKDSIDESRLTSEKKFFKEEIKLYGVDTATVGKIGKHFFIPVKVFPKKDIFELCEELWKSGFIEEALIACNYSFYLSTKYEPSDFVIFEGWINNYVTNWATCDTLCNHTVGAFVEMYPDYIAELKRWAKSPNRWMRRASAVSLIVPAKKGLFLAHIFEIADILLLDKDDLVQKGYGWMLKVASAAHLESVYDYIISRKAVMPRTALRYAIEKMPSDMKADAMKK